MADVPPEQDIGPVYKGFGGLLLIAAVAVLGIHALQGHPIGLHDVLILAVCAVFCLALWRPKAFEKIMESIGHVLPIQFKKPDSE